MKPLLIIVTGRPGSGKTTLAHALAKEIRCPALCRDELKEGFVNTMQGSHETAGPSVNLEITNTFFQTVTFLLGKEITLVAEAAFQHKVWAPKLEPLQDLAKICLIVCTIDPQLARSRYLERGLSDPNRERFHGDPVVRAAREGIELPLENYDPPRLSVPTLEVDTTNKYRPPIADIVTFALSAHS